MANPNWNHPNGDPNHFNGRYGAPQPDAGPNPYGAWGQPQPQPAVDPHAQGAWGPAREVGPFAGANTDPLHSFMTKVFGWMAMGLGVTAMVGWLLFSSNLIYALLPYTWMIFIGQIALVFGLTFGIGRGLSAGLATGGYLLYAATMGVTMGLILAAYTVASVGSVFLVTSATFGFMFVYGWTTKKDLTSWGSLLFMGLIGLIIAFVVNTIFGGETMSLILSAIGVLLFIGITAYDAQNIKRMGAYGFANGEAEQKMAIVGALKLYLDFINLFINLMRLLGDRR